MLFVEIAECQDYCDSSFEIANISQIPLFAKYS